MSPRALLALALVGCAPTAEKTDDSSALPSSGELMLTDAENYGYTGNVLAVSVPVNTAHDLTLDWSSLSVDLRGEAITPAEVSRLDLVAFRADMVSVIEAISSNQLNQSDVVDLNQYDNTDGGSTATLSEFSSQGAYFNPSGELVGREDIASWAVLVERESSGRGEIASLIFLNLVSSDGLLVVAFANDSAVLDFHATLGDPLPAQEGVDYTLDWSGVTTDGSGQPFSTSRINQLFVGHVPADSTDEIESDFVHLIEESDALYGVDAYGKTSADLSSCLDADGNPFPGFTAGGTWLVGLSCLSCSSPAPLVLGHVEVE